MTVPGSPPGVRAALRERAAGLAGFGYRPPDAEFLALAALAGGFFVRRQYRQYVGCGTGGPETRMLRLAGERGHAAPLAGKALYRLRGSAFWKALGCEGAPSGAPRGRRAIKQRLLALDYVLERGGSGTWLLDGRDKAAHFLCLGIPVESFPVAARAKGGGSRAFPEVFPARADAGEPPAVAFSYAHAGSGASGVERHLRTHESLAAALACRGIACEWVMLADSACQFPRLRAAWRGWRGRLLRDWEEREYFGLRRAVAQRRWKDLCKADIDRYARLRVACTVAGIEGRYRKWLERGAPEREPGGDFAESCRYREVLLDYDYSVADRVER